jgi:hypothetical protein
MTESRTYATPAAFRTALTARLRRLAETSPWTLQHLQRQVAYDRILERLYLTDDEWIVKGAAALLARNVGVRSTIDIDIYREAAREEAEAEFRLAAAADIGDWFRFEVRPSRTLDSTDGVRLPVKAFIGNTIWVEFHVDLVGADLRMTGEPEDVPPLARISMPDMTQRGYRAYPLIDHVADKVCAVFERHGDNGSPSARFKDLIDLVAISRSAASLKAGPLIRALRSEARRRGLELPAEFDVPDRALWEPGYASEARRVLVPIERTLDDALAVVRPFLDPILRGTAAGTWLPTEMRWISNPDLFSRIWADTPSRVYMSGLLTLQMSADRWGVSGRQTVLIAP